MTAFSPPISHAVGVVCEPIDCQRSAAYGQCFSLLDTSVFVTPDHVVRDAYDRGAVTLHVVAPRLEPIRADVIRHPAADLAILRVEGSAAIAFAAPRDPDGCEAVRLHAFRDGLDSVESTVTGKRMELGPPARPYRGDVFALADAFGRGFSGSPVVADDGRLLGMHTTTVTRNEVAQGLALRLVPHMQWIRDQIGETLCP